MPARSADAELEVSRSRFVAHVAPVADEDAARAVVAAVRARHPTAGHHCTAFVVGPDARLRHSNDDGEPSGSAGRPMLEVLTGRGVSDVVAVVSRWFGGTLLGVGGLMRAYGDATALSLDAAGTRVRRRRLLVDVTVPVDLVGMVENRLRAGWDVVDVVYGTRVALTLAVEPGRDGDLGATVASLTSGRGDVSTVGETWR